MEQVPVPRVAAATPTLITASTSGEFTHIPIGIPAPCIGGRRDHEQEQAF